MYMFVFANLETFSKRHRCTEICVNLHFMLKLNYKTKRNMRLYQILHRLEWHLYITLNL